MPRPDTNPAAAAATLDALAAELASALRAGHFVRAVLSRYRGPEADLRRIDLRPVALKTGPHLQAVWHHATRDITHNHAAADVAAALRPLLGPQGFRAAHVELAEATLELTITERGAAQLRRRATAAQPAEVSRAHNRERQYLVPLERPFLARLGIVDERGRLVPAMARKWRQINRFVEIADRAIAASPRRDATVLRIADFGCGRGYLTFALHDWLTQGRGIAVETIGVELRRELVDEANASAAALGAAGLHFEAGDLAGWAARPLDVTIALHACDTATDLALALGVRAGASVLLTAPCCHKQLRPQLLAPQPIRPVLRHGIHLGQEAEMVTDSMRALLLELQGYEAQVFEFVSLEHTAKNKMIQAVRIESAREHGSAAAHTAALREELQRLKDWYGIREQALESLLTAAA